MIDIRMSGHAYRGAVYIASTSRQQSMRRRFFSAIWTRHMLLCRHTAIARRRRAMAHVERERGHRYDARR